MIPQNIPCFPNPQRKSAGMPQDAPTSSGGRSKSSSTSHPPPSSCPFPAPSSPNPSPASTNPSAGKGREFQGDREFQGVSGGQGMPGGPRVGRKWDFSQGKFGKSQDFSHLHPAAARRPRPSPRCPRCPCRCRRPGLLLFLKKNRENPSGENSRRGKPHPALVVLCLGWDFMEFCGL